MKSKTIGSFVSRNDWSRRVGNETLLSTIYCNHEEAGYRKWRSHHILGIPACCHCTLKGTYIIARQLIELEACNTILINLCVRYICYNYIDRGREHSLEMDRISINLIIFNLQDWREKKECIPSYSKSITWRISIFF